MDEQDAPSEHEVHVGVAQFRVKSDLVERFARIMLGVVPTVRTNPQNLQFEFYQSQEEATRFLLYQVFSSESAWEAHRASASTKASFEQTALCFAEPPERSAWAPVALAHDRVEPPNAPVGHATRSVFRLQPGRESGHIATLKDYVRGLLGRGGMLRFDLSRSLTDTRRFMIFGRWRDREGWLANEGDPTYSAFKQAVHDDFDGPAARGFWRVPTLT